MWRLLGWREESSHTRDEEENVNVSKILSQRTAHSPSQSCVPSKYIENQQPKSSQLINLLHFPNPMRYTIRVSVAVPCTSMCGQIPQIQQEETPGWSGPMVATKSTQSKKHGRKTPKHQLLKCSECRDALIIESPLTRRLSIK